VRGSCWRVFLVTELVAAPPRFCTRRTDRASYGGEVAKLARILGFEPMLHQLLFWEIALEHDAGVLAYKEVIWTIARQCGKSVALFCLLLWRCLRWPGQVVSYGAQTGMDARSMLADVHWPRLSQSPLGELVTFRRQSGHEAILCENGSRLGLIASSEKSGHGSTLDTAVLDECWAHADFRLEQATRPAMVTRKNAQLYSVSTAGTQQRSPYLWSKVQTGRQAVEAGVTEGIAFLEWSAEADADPSLPETWRQAIPALGVTIDEDTVRGDFLGMPRHEFQRSFLNQWTTAMAESVVELEVWEALAEPDAPRPETLILGVDVSPKSKSAAIAAAGVHDGHLIASILEHGEGTQWVAGRLEGLKHELGAEIIGDRKALSPIWDELEALDVVEIDTAEAAEATSYFLDLVGRGKLRHRGEKELAVALDGAALRPLGDSFAWSRKGSGVDISPLCAVTAAVFGWRWDAWAGDPDEQ
jgi:hypothetical protein